MRRKSLAAVILAFTGLIGSMIWSFLPTSGVHSCRMSATVPAPCRIGSERICGGRLATRT